MSTLEVITTTVEETAKTRFKEISHLKDILSTSKEIIFRMWQKIINIFAITT